MAITKEQIFQVADELDQAGQNPTLANVRKALGGGSFTTISEAMNEWRSRKAAEAAPLRDPAPQAVTDRLAELGGEVWAVALELANARLASEREALEAVRVEMEGSRQEAVELADQLTAELDEAKARIVALEEQAASAKADAEALREKMAGTAERAATAEARAQEVERRAADLRAELDRAHADADQARTGYKAELQRVAEEHRAELRQAHEAAEAARGEAERVRAAITEERDRLAGELATVTTRLEAERERHQEQRQQAAQEASRQAERFVKVQAERDEARKEARKASEEAATLRGRVEGLEIAVSSAKQSKGTQKKTD